jgi:DNA-binding NarL/FixJ family response regulator
MAWWRRIRRLHHPRPKARAARYGRGNLGVRQEGVEMDAAPILIVGSRTEGDASLVDVAGRLGHRACGVADAQSALDRVAVEVPCLVLLDLDRGALELCRELVDRLGPRSPVIILGGQHGTSEDCVAGLLAGADDYLATPFDVGELLARMRRSIERALHRGAVMDRELHLTQREEEILDRLVAGSTEREIARDLVISPKTVATHIQHILTKLDVHSRAQAVARVAGGRPLARLSD